MAWSAEKLSDLATGYWPAAALIAAVELRVFEALDTVPMTAAGVAEIVRADAGRLGALLDALSAVGLLAKSAAATYRIADDVRPLLSRASPSCLLDALAYNGDLYRQWAGLADVVRGGTPAGAGRQLGGDPGMTRRFVLAMDAKAKAFSPAIAAAIDLGDANTLLDVGAGPGTLTRILADRHPRLRATLLDLAPVLAIASEICGGTPVAHRLSYHACDYRAGPLPTPFDAVLFAGALHQETQATAAKLVGEMQRSISAGGRLFVVDLMLDDGRTSPTFSALFQLNMMLLRPGSRVFTTAESEALLTDAGFVDVSTAAIAGTPYRVVSARRGPSV